MRARALALVALLVPACTAPPALAPDPSAIVCTGAALAGCEQRLADAAGRGEPRRPLALAIASARASERADDPWVKLVAALDRATSTAIVVREGDATAVTSARAVDLTALPAPRGVAPEALLLGLAAAFGYEHVIWVRPGSAEQLFPSDPLAPWMGGLASAVRDDAAPAHLDADLAAEALTRAAFTAAGASRYQEAAEAAGKLSAIVGASDRRDEAWLRYRYALQLLGTAGLVLDGDPGTEPPSRAPIDAPVEPADTPYGSYLRVLLAKDTSAAWRARGPKILEGIGGDRRDALTALFAGASGCGPQRPPPMEDARDLVFASQLAAAFPRDPASPPRPGELSIVEWRKRYERLVQLVETAHAGWSLLPALLSERGEAFGVSLAGTATYERVTDMSLAHLAAAQRLQASAPARYRAFTEVALTWSAGVLGDERLQGPLVKLTEAAVAGKITSAKDPESLLLALAAGGAAAVSYPPAMQTTQRKTLADATLAKLQDPTFEKAGWGGALLLAIAGVYQLAEGQRSAAAADVERIEGSLTPLTKDQPVVARIGLATAAILAFALERAPGRGPGPEGKLVERGATRASAEVGRAIAALGSSDELVPSIAADVQSLVLGLATTLTEALEAGATRKPEKLECGEKPGPIALDGHLRDRLGVLGDLRRRILLHPKYKQGDGVWIRRVRLLVTAMSDALDVAVASDAALRAAGRRKRAVLTIPDAEAERVVQDALREIESPAVASLVRGSYGLLRGVAASGSDLKSTLVKRSTDLRQIAAGVLGLLRSDTKGASVALLDELESMHLAVAPTADLVTAFSAYATAFYAAGETDRGDLCLLGTFIVGAFAHTRVPAATLDLAARSRSRVAWVVRFAEEAKRPAPERPNPSAYAADMRKATADVCQAGDPEAVLAVMQASVDFPAGKRAEAKATLEHALETADRTGLAVPRLAYEYDEKTATKVFKLGFDLTFGTGLVGTNSFSLGFGLRSPGEPGGALSVALASPESTRSHEDAARLYVLTAALATVYHLLDGETDLAIGAASRVVSAVTSGVKLGSRAVRSERSAAWGSDAHALIVLAAQLAAEAGQPFLAGDLWTVARQSFEAQSPPLDQKALRELLNDLPIGVRDLPELRPVVARARRSLALVASREPCGASKPEIGGFEESACAAYPLALSLRIADVLKKLPRLKHGGACSAWRGLDGFLASADRGAYDPDAFTQAVESLRAAGKPYDAAALLTRHKRGGHCSPVLVAAARELGHGSLFSPSVRADLLSAAFNCSGAALTPELAADLHGIDAETKRLADPTRNMQLALSVADAGVRGGRWELLGKLVEEPDFVSRWPRVSLGAATWALLLDHAGRVLTGRALALDESKAARDLACDTFRAKDRAELCDAIDALRAPASPTDATRVATEAVRTLLAGLSASSPHRP